MERSDIKSKLFCPRCGSTSLHRSRRGGILERIFLRPLGFRAYRCQDCYNRFFTAPRLPPWRVFNLTPMKQIPEKLRPWLIAAWFLALYAWNLYFAWSAAPAPSTGDDYRRILLDALWQFTTPFHIFLSAIVIGAMFIKWEW